MEGPPAFGRVFVIHQGTTFKCCHSDGPHFSDRLLLKVARSVSLRPLHGKSLSWYGSVSLEDPAFWADFHATFLGCWREAIAAELPDNYDARLDETVNLVQMTPEIIKLIYPDIAVDRLPSLTKRARSSVRVRCC